MVSVVFVVKFIGDRHVCRVEGAGLQTGDASLNIEAPVVVMTTEILRNMLYRVDDDGRTAKDRLAVGEGLKGEAACCLPDLEFAAVPQPINSVVLVYGCSVSVSGLRYWPSQLLQQDRQYRCTAAPWVAPCRMWDWWYWMKYTTLVTLVGVACGRR